MTTFALVHGAWCGAWSWEALTPLLRRAGHDVVAVDLPCDDPSADFEDYAAEVCRALAGRDDQVVIVGHSLGANTIPLVAARRTLQHLVYVAGVMPDIGRSIAEQLSTKDNMMMPVGIRHWANQIHSSERHGSTLTAHAVLYADFDDQQAMATFRMLRPQAGYPAATLFPLTEFPSVSCTSVLYSGDQVVNPKWSRRVAQNRLGVEAIELAGSHCAFFTEPGPMADVLLALAD